MRVCVVSALLMLNLLASHKAVAGQLSADIYGSVRDAATGDPIQSVEVVLKSSGSRALTNAAGVFVFESVSSIGTDTLEFQVLGYAPRSESITLIPGQSTRVTALLSQQAIELSSIQVEVRPSLRARRIREFERRRELFSGFFMSETELERRSTTQLGFLMGDVPGVRVRGGLRPDEPFRIEARGGSCSPMVWVDGQRASAGMDVLKTIRANQIEALEIYRGGEAPAEFNERSSCMTLVVWTRY